MQQRISQWLERLGMEFSDVMSLTMVIGLILLISVMIHLVLHRVVLAALQRRGQQSQRIWQQAITKHKLFQRVALLLQGIIINLQAVLWLQNGSQTQAVIVTAAQVWIMAFALLALFSLLDTLLALLRQSSVAHQLPCAVSAKAETGGCDIYRHHDRFAVDGPITPVATQRLRGHDGSIDVGVQRPNPWSGGRYSALC